MSDPTNLARDPTPARSEESAPSGEAVPEGAAAPSKRRELPKFDFDTPDEASMQFLEEQWRRFCGTIGLEGEIPDIRAIVAARRTNPPPTRRRSHKLVRPLAALSDWLKGHPDLEEP
jgi:hypothetical protein